jgi:hypothetical protein
VVEVLGEVRRRGVGGGGGEWGRVRGPSLALIAGSECPSLCQGGEWGATAGGANNSTP